MTKRIFKYGTGDIIPNGAEFQSTVVENTEAYGTTVRYVWHYYLVEVKE